MYYSKCGNKVPDGASFCPKCGAAIASGFVPGATEAPASQNVAPVVADPLPSAEPAPAAPVPQQAGPMADAPQGGSPAKRALPVTAIVALCVAAAAIVALVVAIPRLK